MKVVTSRAAYVVSTPKVLAGPFGFGTDQQPAFISRNLNRPGAAAALVCRSAARVLPTVVCSLYYLQRPFYWQFSLATGKPL